MNKDVILAVADAIEREALAAEKIKFDMTNWAEKDGCGTAACIAGWTYAMFDADGDARVAPMNGAALARVAESQSNFILHDAGAALGLDLEQRHELFIPHCMSKVTPADAVETLRRLAETGHVVWTQDEDEDEDEDEGEDDE